MKKVHYKKNVGKRWFFDQIVLCSKNGSSMASQPSECVCCQGRDVFNKQLKYIKSKPLFLNNWTNWWVTWKLYERDAAGGDLMLRSLSKECFWEFGVFIFWVKEERQRESTWLTLNTSGAAHICWTSRKETRRWYSETEGLRCVSNSIEWWRPVIRWVQLSEK